MPFSDTTRQLLLKGYKNEKIDRGHLVLDLAGKTQSLRVPLESPPKNDLLRLRIRALEGFTNGAKLRNGLDTISHGAQTVIEFDIPGPEIALRFIRFDGRYLEVRIEPRWRDKPGSFEELTLENLD